MILEKLTKLVGINKNPFTSLTMWGLALYQLAGQIAPVICSPTFPFGLPEAWCAGLATGITIAGEILIILGLRRAAANDL